MCMTIANRVTLFLGGAVSDLLSILFSFYFLFVSFFFNDCHLFMSSTSDANLRLRLHAIEYFYYEYSNSIRFDSYMNGLSNSLLRLLRVPMKRMAHI